MILFTGNSHWYVTLKQLDFVIYILPKMKKKHEMTQKDSKKA